MAIPLIEVTYTSNDEFIITPKEDKSLTIWIGIEKQMQDQLINKSNRSRNELTNLALEYVLKHGKFINSNGIE
ncbi:CopG family transcriptional regulator [Paenibacillus psychroresistens]|uniref:CopG family transcriptional regulator n=1 Tax=Paenibacillus psychroresistens TaxID=1778678 RepID=A0A6B8RFL5_9BACL|nr:CopG family transcriptional regulator [Paenibacillus psychroresistens]QGQ94156.1 CopG family transcriptional regulator [Paenibacillus psychroresistens]